MTDKVKFIFCENLANPGGIVLDLQKIAKVANDNGIPLIVDNTMASPYLCRPFDWGADIVIHSATKYIGGHGNTMGGVIVESGKFDWRQNDKFPSLGEPDPSYHGLTFAETFGDFGFTMKVRAVALRDYGPCMAPQAAWNLLQGVETLVLRMERHCKNALAVASVVTTSATGINGVSNGKKKCWHPQSNYAARSSGWKNDVARTASDPGPKDASFSISMKRKSASEPVGTLNGAVFSAKTNGGDYTIKRRNVE